MNPGLARMLGYDDSAELLARSLEAGPFEASYARADFKRRLEAEGEIRGLEASWTHKNGSRLFIRENARLVRSADGDGFYYEGTVEDVTEQKQAQDELRRRSEEVMLLYEAGRALASAESIIRAAKRQSLAAANGFALDPGRPPGRDFARVRGGAPPWPASMT